MSEKKAPGGAALVTDNITANEIKCKANAEYKAAIISALEKFPQVHAETVNFCKANLMYPAKPGEIDKAIFWLIKNAKHPDAAKVRAAAMEAMRKPLQCRQGREALEYITKRGIKLIGVFDTGATIAAGEARAAAFTADMNIIDGLPLREIETAVKSAFSKGAA